ncbi:DUF5682 family protein, partial [Streptomyces bohaiensis]|uniref:DUF5682 family protein n=2 Tax=Streptomyces bohaiensis TaxID=1431344 RepID=UPI0028AF6A18
MTAAPARAALADLTAPEAPYLIGVRHHSPALAAAVPALLMAADPQVLLVELPADMQPWLRWLADPATTAPVALAAVPARTVAGGGPGTAFYPFAEFSPEFAAVRWAAAAGVPVVACDLPLADRAWTTEAAAPAPAAPRAAGPGSLWQALRDGVTGRAGDDLWDRLVEAAAPGSAPEAVRRAALLAGWALRQDAGTAVPATDLARERHMRGCLAAARADGRRVAAVIGAFHAPALSAVPDAEVEAVPATDRAVPATDPTEPAGARPWPHPDAVVRAALHEHGGDGDDHLPGRTPGHDPTAGHAAPPEVAPDGAWSISLIPYTYALLDERSGYPAGIRDPEWQHHVLTAGGDPAAVADALTTTAVRITAALREAGHPSGPADAREITRLAGDLARLRNLPAPGRGELAEAVQTVLAQGELHGRGRAVARALDEVLVGSRTGAVSPRAPRGGLGPSVERELAELGLPGPHDTARQSRDLRLDPLRSDLDRRRELLLRRLAVCGVPYAEPREVAGTGGGDALTSRWEIRWTPATAAVLTAATVRGVTTAQAAEGVLRERHRAEQDEGGPTAAQILTGLADAADCGVVVLADERLTELADLLPGCATLPELLAALSLVDRVGSGHIPGLPADVERADRAAATAAALTAAGVRQLDGLTGSDDTDDARALVELAHRADVSGGIRLADALTRLAADGSPLMRGAAGAALVLLGQEEPAVLGERAAAWFDAATDPERRAALTARLTGLLTAAGPLLEAVPHTLDPLLGRVTDLPDRDFLDRLPALRGGFDTLSPAARDRLLTVVEERLGTALPDAPADPATLAANARADLAARTVLEQLGLLPPPSPATATAGTVLDGPPATADAAATAGTAPAAETCPTAVAGAAPPPPAEPP